VVAVQSPTSSSHLATLRSLYAEAGVHVNQALLPRLAFAVLKETGRTLAKNDLVKCFRGFSAKGRRPGKDKHVWFRKGDKSSHQEQASAVCQYGSRE